MAAKKLSNPKLLDVLVAPVVTEKATAGSENQQLQFFVSVDATKTEIKEAFEALYDVKVKAVNTINVLGKIKRFRGKVGKRPNRRKAIITLEGNKQVDVMAGI